MKFYIYLLIIAILDLIGMMFAKYSSIKNNNTYIIIPIICFAITAFFISLMLKYQPTAVINMLWVTVSTILVAILSYFIFKESLTLMQISGILVALVGIIMIEWK